MPHNPRERSPGGLRSLGSMSYLLMKTKGTATPYRCKVPSSFDVHVSPKATRFIFYGRIAPATRGGDIEDPRTRRAAYSATKGCVLLRALAHGWVHQARDLSHCQVIHWRAPIHRPRSRRNTRGQPGKARGNAEPDRAGAISDLLRYLPPRPVAR